MSDAQEISPRCSICNEANIKNYGGEWKLQTCKNCGHTEGGAALEKLSRAEDNFFDDDQYILFRSENKSYFESLASKRAADLRANIDHLQDKSLLDIGCSLGEFLNAVKKDCATVKGQDTASGVIEYAERIYDIEIHDSLADFVPEEFDIVTAFHVIEHVDDPHQFIEHIAKFIKPGGWINIRTPNIGSLTGQASGRNWPGISIEHTQLFTPRSLEILLRQGGFENIKLLTRSHARFSVGALQRYLKGGNKITGDSGTGGNRNSGNTRLRIMRVLDVAYAPMGLLESWMKAGDEVVIFARKTDAEVMRADSSP